MPMTKSTGVRVRRGTRQRWVEEQQGKHLCQCGCGEPILLVPTHFNTGVPRYLHGHNAKINPPRPRKPRPPASACACGCGQLASPGRRYISGHNSTGRRLSADAKRRIAEANTGARSHRFGKRADNWAGGRTRVRGYVAVWAPEHPRMKHNYVLEHRLVVERDLQANDPTSEYLRDGYLHPGADVHHVNGVKDDNRRENLQVMWRSEHTRLHHALKASHAAVGFAE
jgi:hypothetical protein